MFVVLIEFAETRFTAIHFNNKKQPVEATNINKSGDTHSTWDTTLKIRSEMKMLLLKVKTQSSAQILNLR